MCRPGGCGRVTTRRPASFYINFKKPSHADDSELLENDVLVRYEQGEVIGITVLNASRRAGGAKAG